MPKIKRLATAIAPSAADAALSVERVRAAFPARQAETERSKPVLPGAREKPETPSARGREGNHYRTFVSTTAATGLAAMRDSRTSGEVPYRTSAR
jgi:hypothetical protein